MIEDPAVVARAIIDDNLYMVLGTADEDGRPWVSPVYFAHLDYREFLWVSRPDVQHSQNLAARPETSIVVFNSSTPIGTGRGVYMSALAEEVAGDARIHAIDLFSRRSVRHGGTEWTLSDIQAPAPLRLYRAKATAHYVLAGSADVRIEVALATPVGS